MPTMKSNIHNYTVFITVLFIIPVTCSQTNKHQCKIYQHKADCKYRNLTSIPQDLDPSITSLDLQFNRISDLRGRQFERYNKLLFLELSNNSIESIPNDAFYGLPNIGYIALAVNKLKDGSLKNCEAFTILHHLTTIDIGGNLFDKVPDVSVFNNQLSVLKLSSLNWEGKLRDSTLGKGFEKLTNLTELYLQDMQIQNLNFSTFQHVSSTLKLLWLQGNQIMDIANDTFSRLNKLQTLFLDQNPDLSNPVIENGLAGLVHTDIRDISLRSIHIRTIENTTLMKLRNTPLQRLDFHNSQIEEIDDYAFRYLGNLSTLILAAIFISEVNNNTLYGLSKLKHLDLSENFELAKIGYSLRHVKNLEHLTLEDTILFNDVNNYTFKGLNRLKTLEISYSGLSYLPKGAFRDLSSLYYLDISSNSALGNVDKGLFHGLTNVSILNISNTGIQDLFDNFCEEVPQLKELQTQTLKVSKLQDSVFRGCNHLETVVFSSCWYLKNISTAFAHINSLRFLDLSYNVAFAQAPVDGAFNISPRFETLLYNNVQENGSYISKIPSAIKYSTHIDTLDIRSNDITHFTKSDLNFFSIKLKYVKAESNPFNCSCDLISPFYYWLRDKEQRKSVIKDDDLEYYLCDTPANDTGRPIIYFDMRECNLFHVNFTVALVSSLLVLVILVLSGSGIVYYYRWTIRYFWYYISVIRKNRNNPEEQEELDYNVEFDAFISYSLRDIKFVKEVLLKTLESSSDGQNDKDFIYSTPSDANFKAHYQNTVSAIVMICIKSFKQTQRRVLYRPTKLLHYLACMCPILLEGKTHPAAKVLYRNRTLKAPLCIQIKKTKHTSNVSRKFQYKKNPPCYDTKKLHFDNERMWLKKWVKPYIKIIRKLKEKDRKLQRQLKQQRVQEEETSTPTNNLSSMYSTSVAGSSLHAAQSVPQARFRFLQDNNLTTVSRNRNQNTSIDIESNQTATSSERIYCPIYAENLPKYKLMVCHRDFPSGGDIAETIVLYMEKSRKSIVCISDDFLQGEWTMFEWEITVRERNGALLLVLLNPDIDRKKMPRYMRSLLKSKLYLEWTENDDYGKRYFWAKLKDFLGKPIEEIRKEERNVKYIMEKKKELKRKNKNEREMKQLEQRNNPGPWAKENLLRNQQLPKDTWVSTRKFGKPLTLSERERILERHDDGWISKKIINACMAVLCDQFPEIGGLQDCNYAASLSFESNTRPFVQILNMFSDRDSEIHGNVHWIVASTINCKAGNITLYDSQNFDSVPEHVKMSIANLLQAQELNKYTISLIKSPQQLKDVDCGVYSIANAVSLLYSYNPATIDYVGSTQMRRHIVKCLEKGEFSMFPTKARKKFFWFSSGKKYIRHKRIVEIHCLCKMLLDINMIRCRFCARFFHPSCLGQIMPGAQFRAYRGNYELTCNDCNDKKFI